MKKVVIHGGSGSTAPRIEQDLVSRLKNASARMEFVALPDYNIEREAPYAIVWYQDGRRDLFEQFRDTDIRRIVMHNPRTVRIPSPYAHVRVSYPSLKDVEQILKALDPFNREP